MTHELILIDDHAIVPRPVGVVSRRLGGHTQIAAWFCATVESASATITSEGQRLVVEDINQRWMPNDQMLTVDGVLGEVRLHAHVTVFEAVPFVIDERVDEVTEIWVHVELSLAPGTEQIASIIRAVIARGLERLSVELGGPVRPPTER